LGRRKVCGDVLQKLDVLQDGVFDAALHAGVISAKKNVIRVQELNTIQGEISESTLHAGVTTAT